MKNNGRKKGEKAELIVRYYLSVIMAVRSYFINNFIERNRFSCSIDGAEIIVDSCQFDRRPIGKFLQYPPSK